MHAWHDRSCRRADVYLVDNIPACMSCGSVYTAKSLQRGNLSITIPTVGGGFTELQLTWPATVTYSSSEDIKNPDIRTALALCPLIHVRQQGLVDNDQTDLSDHEKMSKTSGESSVRNPDPTDPSADLAMSSRETAHKGPLSASSAGPDYIEHPNEGHQTEHIAQERPRDRMYKPLNAQDEIRVLRLSSSDSGHSQVLHGSLIHLRLSQRPDFTALSYTWADISGDRSRCETIFVGMEWTPLPITSNCAAALRSLRSSADTRLAWVDAICIDQDNIDERSQQVGLMRDIYSRARKVIIFLGDDGPQETLEGELIHRMGEQYRYEGNAMQITWSFHHDWQALRALFERPYWTRLWVIQEVLLAKESILVLGGDSLPLSRILKGRVRGDNDVDDVTRYFPSWTQVTGPSVYGDVEMFSELLIKTSSCQAMDDRDRVFALLGLVQGAALEGLVADYTKTIDEVYIGIAAYFILVHGQTNILKWAVLSKDSVSWVPTWQVLAGGVKAMKHTFFLHNDMRLLNAPVIKRLSPDHLCRVSGSQPNTVGDLLQILRPRVFQGTGALVLRAYPVVRLDRGVLSSAFDEHWNPSGTSLNGQALFCLKPCTRSAFARQYSWTIHGHKSDQSGQLDDYHLRPLCEDWIVEVPNCDTFLHLQPRWQASEVYRVASVCYLSFTSDIETDPLTLLQCRGNRAFEDHTLLLRLVVFELHHLDTLESLEKLTDGHDSFLRPRENSCIQLPAATITRYSRWIEYLRANPASSLGPTTGDSRSIFEPALKAVSSYLDGWSDSSIWDQVKILRQIDWAAYADRLYELRQGIWSGIPPHDLDPPWPGHSTTSSDSDVDPWAGVREYSRQKLRELLDDLMKDVDELDLSGLRGDTAHLGAFKLSGTAESLYQSISDFSSWYTERFGAEQDEIFHEWTAFGSHLRHMQSSKCQEVREKFIQRQVLRSLYTRCGLREFVIC